MATQTLTTALQNDYFALIARDAETWIGAREASASNEMIQAWGAAKTDLDAFVTRLAETRAGDPDLTVLKARVLFAQFGNRRDNMDFAIEALLEAARTDDMPTEALALSIVRDLLDQMGPASPLPVTW